MEIFKDIQGYEGLYQVSNLGNVRNIISNKPIKGYKNNEGYLNLRLYKDKNRKSFKIHRLVGFAFIPIIEGKLNINHINGIKNDNRVENLEWCNQSENVTHGYRVLNSKGGFKNNPEYIKNKHSKSVTQYNLNNIPIKTWKSASEIERVLGFSRSCISDCCNNKIKTSAGYIWKFAE